MALATEEEIASALGKQGATNIRKGEERIQTNIYILTLNQPHTSKKVKIGFCNERVEQYVPVLLRCFKYQKPGHHRKACGRWQTCVKCGEKDPDHVEEDCLKEIDVQTAGKIIRLTQGLAMFTKKEKEIIEVKHKRNLSFMEARKIVGSYMGENCKASIARSADRTNKTTNIEHSWRN